MRSTFLVLAWGAVSTALPDTCNDADSQSLLQARKLVRAHKQKKTTAADDLLSSMRDVAKTFTADSATTMTPAEVNAALGTASTSLQAMLPLFEEQHSLAQREIGDALAAVQVCQDQHGGEERARLERLVTREAAAKNECEATLAQLVEAENEACARAEDCLCDEARVETTGQRTLCASLTETYEVVFCDAQSACNMFHQCHSQQMDIYSALRADIEAEMLARQTEYRTYMQVDCVMNLITAAMLSGTPIPDADLVACDNADVSRFALDFPAPPAAPTACPAWQRGDPHCQGAGSWTVLAHHDYTGGSVFASNIKDSYIENAGDPSASTHMIIGQIDPSDYLIDGKYHMRLVYTGVRDAHRACNNGPALSGTMEAEWLQSSWITETTVTGFEAISPSDLATSGGGAGCIFTGLAQSSIRHTALDGSHNFDWYFGSVGTTIVWSGGIPAFKGGVASTMTLYIQRA